MANKIVALVGPHASGKTMLIDRLIELGLNYIPNYTTSSIEGEKHYVHLDKLDFFKQDFISKYTYKNDYYGILKQDVLKSLRDYPITMTILSVAGVKQMSKLLKGNFETVYIMCDYVTLVERMIRMGHTNTDIKYHLEYAENNNEFDSWKITTHVVKNVSDPERSLAQLLTILGLTRMMPPESFMAAIRRIGPN